MLSFQEMRSRMEKPDNKTAAERVLQQLDRGYYDYDEMNLYGTGYDANEQPIKPADFNEIKESVSQIPFRFFAKEFLARGSSTGLAGGGYLIVTKIHQVLFDSAVQADICADLSISMIPPDQIPGTTHQVDIAIDDSYVPKKFQSGGAMPTETIAITTADLDFTNSWGINFRITNDLIEDSQFDVIEMHLRNAGREMGEFATNEAVTVLQASTDGDGTLNTEGAGVDTTTFTDVYNGLDANLRDGYVSDIFLSSREQLRDQIAQDTTFTQDATGFRDHLVTEAYPERLLGMKCVYSECNVLTHSWTSGNAFEDLDCFCLSKEYSLLTGRKRWLRIEKYSDPVRDLVGATITARQDSVSVYNDSVCRIRET